MDDWFSATKPVGYIRFRLTTGKQISELKIGDNINATPAILRRANLHRRFQWEALLFEVSLLVYLVDNTIDGQGASPREIRAVLGRLIPGLEILIEPFHNVSLERVRSLRPSHIILSGQSHPWEMYTPESLAGVF